VDNFSNSEETVLEGIEAITGKRIKNYAIDLSWQEATEQVFKEHRILKESFTLPPLNL
jgi:UDP-glucose 4-epimerase